jgi:ribulose-5-phosphate 4-epimerase/fuculose-1-phosphate aldolase
MAKHDLAVLDHHGQVTAGKSADDVIQKAVFFELACELVLRSRGAAKPLSPEAIEALGHA